jgi:NADPH2:quinone reductase
VKPGDEVYFCDGGFGPTPGTYQEAKVVDERYLALKPKHLSFVEAAAAPLVTITAWEAQRERARVTDGQFVLVHAGAGGVGHMSVQIARLVGARVATTVSRGKRTEVASSVGAELCIDYLNQDVGQLLRSWTGIGGRQDVHRKLFIGATLRRPCFECRKSVGEKSSRRIPQEELASLVHMDAGTVGVRLARAAGPTNSDPGAGGIAF